VLLGLLGLFGLLLSDILLLVVDFLGLFLVLDEGLDFDVGLGFVDGDLIGHHVAGTHLTLGVIAEHDFNLNTEDTLPHHDVLLGFDDVVVLGLTGRDKITIPELHDFLPLLPQLTTDNNLATGLTVLHDEPKNTIASPPDGETTEEFEPEGFLLLHLAAAPVPDEFLEQFDGTIPETEPLLDQAGQFPDPPTLLTEDFPGPGLPDDDLGPDGGDPDLNTLVTILTENPGEELVQLLVEDTVLDEFPLLGDVLVAPPTVNLFNRRHLGSVSPLSP